MQCLVYCLKKGEVKIKITLRRIGTEGFKTKKNAQFCHKALQKKIMLRLAHRMMEKNIFAQNCTESFKKLNYSFLYSTQRIPFYRVQSFKIECVNCY